MRNRIIGSELFDADRQTDGHTDGRRDITMQIVVFVTLRTHLKL